MTDEELLEAAVRLPILYFDGYGAYQRINGVLRCVGYDLRAGPQYNLVTSLVGAEQANRDTRRCLDEKPIKGVIWGSLRWPH